MAVEEPIHALVLAAVHLAAVRLAELVDSEVGSEGWGASGEWAAALEEDQHVAQEEVDLGEVVAVITIITTSRCEILPAIASHTVGEPTFDARIQLLEQNVFLCVAPSSVRTDDSIMSSPYRGRYDVLPTNHTRDSKRLVHVSRSIGCPIARKPAADQLSRIFPSKLLT